MRVAVAYDDSLRPDTTGGYCLRALRSMASVTHFRPERLRDVCGEFDLYLRVDDGLGFRLPPGLGPSALWAIDTHLSFPSLLSQARDFDLVFAAQKQGAERFRAEGIRDCEWLPLACDPEIHRRLEVEREYDVAFVGHVFPGPRQALLEQVQAHFPRSFIGRRPPAKWGSRPAKIEGRCWERGGGSSGPRR